MPDQNFNHDLFSNDQIAKDMGDSVQDFFQKHLVDELNEMILVHTGESEEANDPGGFIPQRNFLLEFLRRASNSNPGQGDVGSMSTQLLIDNIKFIPGTSIQSDGFGQPNANWRAWTTSVLNELASRARESAAQRDFIAASFREKRRIDADSTILAEQNPVLESAPRVLGHGLASIFKDLSEIRSFFTTAAKRVVRKIGSRSSDYTRVSMEPHEYRYCRFETSQFPDAIQAIFDYDQQNGQVIDEDPPLDLLTYGMFVDLPLARRLIGRLRRVRRRVFAANVKDILKETNTTQQDLFEDIRNAMDLSAEVAELENYLGR